MDHVEPQTLINPFPGLRPFESSENHLFFGRDGQSNELLRKLRETHFLAVVGASGSGKSSLVRAGLFPDLHSGMMAGSNTKWRIAIFRPGGDPMTNMARALSKPDVLVDSELDDEDRQMQEQFIRITLGRSTLGLVEAMRQANMPSDENLLVVVDQFEELFRFADNTSMPDAHDQAAAFVKVLLTSAEQKELPIYVVITMRSDYLGDCARFRDLPEAINEGQYLIPRMTRNQGREAITGPVAVGGAQITPRLVQHLLNGVASNPDQLPILQHALMRTWEHWKTRGAPESPIDISDYNTIGGMEQALSLHADEAFNELLQNRTPEQGERLQAMAEKLFKFLTEKGPDNREIRRQAILGDIVTHTGATEEEIISIVEIFRKPGYSFLMPPRRKLESDTVIDISHESLIRQWTTLNTWVDEEAESSKTYLRLAESARLHRQNKKDHLFGLELEQYLEWRENFKPDLAWAKRYSNDCKECLDYLEQSKENWQKAKEEKQALLIQEEQRRKKELKRTRVFAAILALATLVSILFLFYANQQKGIADKQKELALTQRDIAQANYQISEAQLQVESDPTIALRLAEEALKINQSPVVLNAAHKIYRENVFYKTLLHDEEVYSVAFSPDGATMLTGSKDGSAQLWDLKGKLVLKFAAHAEAINAVAFAPDGRNILTGSLDGLARLWDLNGELIIDFKHPQSVTALAFTPDGRKILTGSETARLWDLEGKLIRTIGQTQISSIAISPDGNKILTASYDRTAKIWDLRGTLLKEFGGDSDYIYSGTFSPDGSKIMTGSVDGIAKLWHVQDGLIQTFSAHTNRISSLAFSPNGNEILTGSYDNFIRLWDLQGNQLEEFRGHSNRIASVAFSNDGRKVVTGSYDRTARIWELKGKLIREFAGHSSYIFSVAFSLDGSKLLSGSYDNTARLWDQSGKLLQVLTGHTDRVHAVAFSFDGTKMLTGSDDHSAYMWNLQGEKIAEFLGHKDQVASVAFSPDGTKVLTGSSDNTARLWDLQGKMIKEIGSHDDRISSASFSPEGSEILTASWDGTARMWNLEGQVLTEFKGHTDQIHSADIASDGSKVLTGSGDGSAKLWDMDGQMLLDLSGHSGIISSVDLSLDGTKILTATLDQSAYLWDLSGNLLQEYQGRIFSATFSPDGTKFLTGSGETGQLWDGVLSLTEFLQSGKIDELKQDPKVSLSTN